MVIVRFPHEFFVGFLFSHWVVAEIDFLQLLKSSQWFERVKFGDVVLVENDLTQILVLG